MAAVAQALGEPGELGCRLLGQGLPGQPRLQLLGIGKGPFEPAQLSGVGKLVELDLVGAADRVRPIRMNLEPGEIADDQQGRVFERRRITLELGKGRLQILALALVLPTETAALPDIGPAFAAGRLGGALFKGVSLAFRVQERCHGCRSICWPHRVQGHV